MSSGRENRVYEFAEFRLDPGERLLLRAGERVRLSPRAFALLVALVEQAGRLVEKEALLREVWEGAAVEEGNLNRTVSNLRKALGERPDENRFIETVPRAGYRFIAPVRPASDGAGAVEEAKARAGANGDEGGASRAEEADAGRPTARAVWRRRRWLVPSIAAALALALVSGILGWRRWREEPAPRATDPYAPVRLTDSPLNDSHPRWTRDGRIRFFRTDAARRTESFVMQADGSDQTAVKDFPQLKYGVWSPDGRRVIFAKPDDRTAYYLADAGGAHETALPFYAGNFDWSADGRQIVYQKMVEANSEIFVYTVETGASRNVTNHPDFDADPSFSPDGRQIVFVSSREGNLEVYLLSLEGGAPRRLTDHPATDSHPVFSPDATQIAFSSDRENENADVYLVDVAGGRPRRLTDWPSAEWVGTGCWSPDGTRLAFASDRNGHDDIYVVSAEGFRPRKVLADGRQELRFPSYSPDGRSVLHVAELEDKGGEVRILDMVTGRVRAVARDGRAAAPAWSPDGAWIAFQSQVGGDTDIFVVRPDGTDVRNLTDSPSRDVAPAFSPDGRRIAFASNRDGDFSRFNLYLMNADGTNQHRIYYSNAVSAFPSWSPDGRELVFANDKEDNRTGNFELFVIEPETGAPERRLTRRPRFDTQPAFSPDGRRLAFVSEADGNPEIYLMNADGTGLLRLTRNAAEDSAPRWSPDGTKIIFSSTREQRSSLYEVEAP